jgi:hypothetical protein
MTELAKKNAAAIAAGHSFIVFLGEGFYPLKVLNTLKLVPEVCPDKPAVLAEAFRVLRPGGPRARGQPLARRQQLPPLLPRATGPPTSRCVACHPRCPCLQASSLTSALSHSHHQP